MWTTHSVHYIFHFVFSPCSSPIVPTIKWSSNKHLRPFVSLQSSSCDLTSTSFRKKHGIFLLQNFWGFYIFPIVWGENCRMSRIWRIYQFKCFSAKLLRFAPFFGVKLGSNFQGFALCSKNYILQLCVGDEAKFYIIQHVQSEKEYVGGPVWWIKKLIQLKSIRRKIFAMQSYLQHSNEQETSLKIWMKMRYRKDLNNSKTYISLWNCFHKRTKSDPNLIATWSRLVNRVNTCTTLARPNLDVQYTNFKQDLYTCAQPSSAAEGYS